MSQGAGHSWCLPPYKMSKEQLLGLFQDRPSQHETWEEEEKEQNAHHLCVPQDNECSYCT